MKNVLCVQKKIKELQGDLSNRAFAELCGISEGAVRSLKGGGNPTTKTLEKIAKATNTDINEFFITTTSTNTGPVEKKCVGKTHSLDPSNISPGPSMANAQKIPIISWVQAGDWQDVFDPYQPGVAEDWVLTTETNHPNAFALVVHGDSMEPEFLEGDIVTVDPGRDAINGSYVIAKNGEEATFKQLVIDGSNVYLKPLNTRYPIKDITGIEIKIVGVVVEKRKRY